MKINQKRIFQISLLAFVLLSLSIFAFKHFGLVSSTSSSPLKVSSKDHQVIVYYFHGTARCPTCRTIEAFTKDSITEKFSSSLKKGALIFMPVNVEENENRHFIQDFQLTTRSVVLAQMKKGQLIRWKNLDQVWNLFSMRWRFLEYIQNEVTEYLGPKK